MDFKSLDYFIQVCRHQSYTKAARESYISPQGLRKSIRMLEQELEVSLFIKTEKGKDLTKYGECLRNFALQWLNDYRQMRQCIRALSEPWQNRLRVAFSYGTIGSLGIDLISAFQKRFPHIELIYGDFTDLVCDEVLKEDAYDLGFTIAPYSDSFHTIHLNREKICFWINKANPLSRKPYVTYEDIRGEKIMMVGKEFKAYNTFREGCRRHGFTPDFVLTTSEMGLLRQMVAENQGIAQTVEHEIYLREERKVMSCVPLEGVYWSYGISYLKNRVLNDCENLFLTFILEENRKKQERKNG